MHHCGAILITKLCRAHFWVSARKFGADYIFEFLSAKCVPKKGGESPPNDRNFKTYAADCPEALSLCAIQDRVVSSIRLEKPHSLSYHESTFVRPPKTLV